MDITKFIFIFGISVLIYIVFIYFGFILRDKNREAQNIKKEE